MKAVWSLWTKPLHGSRHPGWLSDRHHYLSWILSFETARRHYPDTCLVTDSRGAELLVDGLGLGFAEVRVELDALADQDPDWWALAKLHAYAVQTEPFVHIDTDVYLWNALPARLQSAAVFAQNPEWREQGRSLYRPEWLEHWLGTQGGWLPAELTHAAHPLGLLRAENCGIFGGTQVDFITHYARQALEIIRHPDNQPMWPAVEHKDTLMVLIEQYVLSACIEYHRNRRGSPFSCVDIAYLFPTEQGAFNDAHADAAGYTHLLASAKRNLANMARLERRVRECYPEAYRRCLALTPDPGQLSARVVNG